MKLIENKWQSKKGVSVLCALGSEDDAWYKERDYTLLGQVVSEIETPKKEVEKVVGSIVPDTCGAAGSQHKRVVVWVPKDSYGHELHYKIKE